MENEIVLPNAQREVIEEFLRFLYTDAVPPNIEDLAPSLLPLADQYMVESLRQICARALEKKISEATIVDSLITADLHRCPDLKKKCFVWAKENFSQLAKTDRWSRLKHYPDLLLEIMVFGVGQ